MYTLAHFTPQHSGTPVALSNPLNPIPHDNFGESSVIALIK
jgi:hypothetical protein